MRALRFGSVMMFILSRLIASSPPFRYVVCKGLRPNIQDVQEHMFNANVRINKMKNQDIDGVVEVRVTSCVCTPFINREFMDILVCGH